MLTIHILILTGIYGAISIFALIIAKCIYKLLLYCFLCFKNINIFRKEHVDTQNDISVAKPIENKYSLACKIYSSGIDRKNYSRDALDEYEQIVRLAKECRMTPMAANRGVSFYGWTDISRKIFIDSLIKNYGNKITTMEIDSDDLRIDADIRGYMKEKFFKKRIVYFGKQDIFSDLADIPINKNDKEKNIAKVTIYTYHGIETYRFIY